LSMRTTEQKMMLAHETSLRAPLQGATTWRISGMIPELLPVYTEILRR